MAPSKKHHYVPQSYLRRFRSDTSNSNSKARAWTLYKPRMDIISKRVHEIACENQYNTIEGSDNPTAIESLFANEIEPKSEWAISAVIKACRDESQFYQPHKELLAHHLAFQYLRLPEARQLQKVMLETFGEGFMTSLRLVTDKYHDTKLVPNLSNARYLKFSLDVETRKTVEQALYQMYWTVIKCPPYLKFITSDNPIISWKGGIQELGNIIYFPLSPEYLLKIVDYRTSVNLNPKLVGTEGSVRYCDEAFVMQANMMQVLSCHHHCVSAVQNFDYMDRLKQKLPEYFTEDFTRFEPVSFALAEKSSNGRIVRKPNIRKEEELVLHKMGVNIKRLPLEQVRALVTEIFDSRIPESIRKTF